MPNFFAIQAGDPRAALLATVKAARRLIQARNRLDAARSRSDTRAWVVARRERTRHLIELGGLVQKAGLVGIADDDRALLYGAFLALALQMQGEDAAQVKLLFRRRGARAFATEAEEAAAARSPDSKPKAPDPRTDFEA